MKGTPINYKDMIREHFLDLIREDPMLVVYLETTPFPEIISTIKEVVVNKAKEITQNEQGYF